MGSRSGELFNRTKLIKDRAALDDVAQDRGYAYANITPVTAVNEAEKTVDLTFDTQKGKLASTSSASRSPAIRRPATR